MLIDLPESVAMTMVQTPNSHLLFSRQYSSTMDSDNTVNDHKTTKMPLLPPELPVTPAIKEELQQVVPQVAPHHFVFAYGSLICRKSRAITAPSLADKEAIPVQVQDVERIWAKRTKRGMTAMGVRFRPGAVCTGVLLPVTEAELQRFDQREEGYDRYLIPLDNVQEVPFLADENHYEKMDYEHADVVFDSNSCTNDDGDATDDEKAETSTTISTATTTNTTTTTTTDDEQAPSRPEVFVWIYVQRYDCPADEDFPIAQSYVDIILRGCMGISKEFARSFIETTKGWSPEEVYGEGNAEDPVYDSDNDEADDNDGPSPTCMATSNSNNNNNNDTKDSTSDDGDQAAATWVDDRDEPIYMRADPVYSEKKADVIDQLLEDHIPEHLDNREPVAEPEDDGGLA